MNGPEIQDHDISPRKRTALVWLERLRSTLRTAKPPLSERDLAPKGEETQPERGEK